MDEKLIALSFYRTMMQALKTEGIERIILTLDDGIMMAYAELIGDEREDSDREME